MMVSVRWPQVHRPARADVPQCLRRGERESVEKTLNCASRRRNALRCAARTAHSFIHSSIHPFIHPSIHPSISILPSFISFHFISFHFISFHFISFHFISFHFISFHFISFHFISFHFISFHFISFHFISFHFISFHFISFHFISFHFISFHFISFHFISFHFISFHFISFHFISFHFISFHFISFHFISFIHMHSATGHTRACDSVRVVSRSVRCRACVHCALTTGVCMWSVGTLFRARGIDATVGVQRIDRARPYGTPSALLGPHSPRARTRASRCRPPPVPGRGFAGIPVCLCSAAGPTYSQFP